jgi:hypothetical protein
VIRRFANKAVWRSLTCRKIAHSFFQKQKLQTMKRKEFLQGLGLTGVGAFLTGQMVNANTNNRKASGPMPPNCVLIPSETAGPFPLDLSANTTFYHHFAGLVYRAGLPHPLSGVRQFGLCGHFTVDLSCGDEKQHLCRQSHFVHQGR